MPGNIRRAEHFLGFLKRFIIYLKGRMGVQQVESETPHSFLGHLQTQVAIDGGFLILEIVSLCAASQHLHCVIWRMCKWRKLIASTYVSSTV